MNNGKCEKTLRYQTCNNRMEKKKLFGIRSKLSYYNVFSQNICWQ